MLSVYSVTIRGYGTMIHVCMQKQGRWSVLVRGGGGCQAVDIDPQTTEVGH